MFINVIDCITPKGNIVGYVNGKPYNGSPFHIHPTTGAKMVGVAHTTSAHLQYIIHLKKV